MRRFFCALQTQVKTCIPLLAGFFAGMRNREDMFEIMKIFSSH
jgi:hypothetical protein